MILDIIILIFIAGSVVLGYKKGFTDTTIRLFGGIIGIILAFMLQGNVAEVITKNTAIEKQIAEGIKKQVTEMVINEETSKEAISSDSSKFTTNSLFSQKYADIKKAKGNVRKSKIDEWSLSIAKFIVKGISFVSIFIVVFLIITILRMVLGGVMELPVLKQLDSLAGLGVGFVLAIIELLVIFSIISFISPMQIMDTVNKLIENSKIAKIIYDNNFLVTIIAKKLL